MKTCQYMSMYTGTLDTRMITEGSLEAKLPTIWTNGTAEVGRVREEKRREERRGEERRRREKIREEKEPKERAKRKSQKKEDAGARKGRTVAKHCVFSWFCGSGGLKNRLVDWILVQDEGKRGNFVGSLVL